VTERKELFTQRVVPSLRDSIIAAMRIAKASRALSLGRKLAVKLESQMLGGEAAML
jgi:hypothetical protein